MALPTDITYTRTHIVQILRRDALLTQRKPIELEIQSISFTITKVVATQERGGRVVRRDESN